MFFTINLNLSLLISNKFFDNLAFKEFPPPHTHSTALVSCRYMNRRKQKIHLIKTETWDGVAFFNRLFLFPGNITLYSEKEILSAFSLEFNS